MKIDVWTAGKGFDLLREYSENSLLLCAPNTLFGISSYPSDRKTHVRSIDPPLVKPWRIWRGCSYKNHVPRIYLLILLLLQTSKENCARSNMKFSRTDQIANNRTFPIETPTETHGTDGNKVPVQWSIHESLFTLAPQDGEINQYKKGSPGIQPSVKDEIRKAAFYDRFHLIIPEIGILSFNNQVSEFLLPFNHLYQACSGPGLREVRSIHFNFPVPERTESCLYMFSCAPSCRVCCGQK